jgi:hypothetical protein
MQLRTEALRIQQMISAITTNWAMFRMEAPILDLIEAGAANGDKVLKQTMRDLLPSLKAITKVEDYNTINQAYEFYAEAAAYLLLKDRGLLLTRTEGTGGHGEKRPDFRCDHPNGTFYIEVKTLDFQDGWIRHKEVALDALESKAELDARARAPGVHIGNPIEISSHRPGTDSVNRIETIIKKIKGNVKKDQLNYGPTILIVDLSRLLCDADDPSSLVPVYFDETAQSCVSGELWHVGFGEVGDCIFVRPEFEGKSNLGGKLKETGVYVDNPELMAIAFIVRPLSDPPKIFALQKLTPDFSSLPNKTALDEFKIGEILYKVCDSYNDDCNERAFDKQVRK